MSSQTTPRDSSTANCSVPKSSPTGPTGRTSVKKLAARLKCTAAPPSMRSRSPNGVLPASKAIDPTTVSAIPRSVIDRHNPSELHQISWQEGRKFDAVRRRENREAAPQALPCETPRPVKAIQIEEFGGPEVLSYVDVPDPSAKLSEVVVNVKRSGVNFADTHASRNDYLAEQTLPLTPGAEASGQLSDGRRVVALLGSGGYAEKVAVPQSQLIELPPEVDYEQAAGGLLQGLTALALVHRCARIEPGETVVVEAAAGGTGTLAAQLAKRAGARVIGLASSEEKRELVRSLGADATVDSRAEELGEAIRGANDGKRVDAVLHMSGGEAFDAELDVLAPLGRMVVFGIASREQRQVSTASLLRGSKAVIGFWLAHLLMRQDLLVPMIQELLAAIAAKELTVTIGDVSPLSEAARAHEDLIARRTSGKLLLDPSS